MRLGPAHHLLIVFAIAFAALLLPALAPPTANADIKGPCVAGIRKRSDASTTMTNVNQIGSPGSAYKVDGDEPVLVVMQSSAVLGGFEYHRFQLEFAGIRWTIAEKFDDGTETTWVESFNVDKYAKYGKGLYKVIGYGRLTDGQDCIGIAYVDVGGNRLSAFAGAVAAAATSLATVAVVGAGAAAAGGKDPLSLDKIGDKIESTSQQEELDAERETQRRAAEEAKKLKAELDVIDRSLRTGNPFCVFFILPALLMTGMAMATGGGQTAPSPLPATRRMSWRPRLSAVALFSGLIGGAGAVVLLQQFSVLFPSLPVAIIGLAGGLAIGILIPSLGGLIRVRRVNRKLARLEARLKGLEAQPGAGGGQS